MEEEKENKDYEYHYIFGIRHSLLGEGKDRGLDVFYKYDKTMWNAQATNKLLLNKTFDDIDIPDDMREKVNEFQSVFTLLKWRSRFNPISCHLLHTDSELTVEEVETWVQHASKLDLAESEIRMN